MHNRSIVAFSQRSQFTIAGTVNPAIDTLHSTNKTVNEYFKNSLKIVVGIISIIKNNTRYNKSQACGRKKKGITNTSRRVLYL